MPLNGLCINHAYQISAEKDFSIVVKRKASMSDHHIIIKRTQFSKSNCGNKTHLGSAILIIECFKVDLQVLGTVVLETKIWDRLNHLGMFDYAIEN